MEWGQSAAWRMVLLFSTGSSKMNKYCLCLLKIQISCSHAVSLPLGKPDTGRPLSCSGLTLGAFWDWHHATVQLLAARGALAYATESLWEGPTCLKCPHGL